MTLQVERTPELTGSGDACPEGPNLAGEGTVGRHDCPLRRFGLGSDHVDDGGVTIPGGMDHTERAWLLGDSGPSLSLEDQDHL